MELFCLLAFILFCQTTSGEDFNRTLFAFQTGGCRRSLRGYYSVLLRITWYRSVLSGIVLNYLVSFCSTGYRSVLLGIVLYYRVLFCIIGCHSVLLGIVLYYRVSFCIIWCRSVLSGIVLYY